MKKLFALLLAGMLLALGACGGEEERVSAPSSLETEGQKEDETATEEERFHPGRKKPTKLCRQKKRKQIPKNRRKQQLRRF